MLNCDNDSVQPGVARGIILQCYNLVQMNDFLQIVQLIQTARSRAIRAVNSELVNLYWQIGQYVSLRLEEATWGDKMVSDLAVYIKKKSSRTQRL